MTKHAFFADLKATVPHVALPWLVSALRHDPVVWAYVKTQGARQVAKAQTASQLQSWTPAALALQALQSPQSPEELHSIPLQPPPHPLQEQAFSALKQADDGSRMTLPKAGLLALGLRERYRQTGTWETALAKTPPLHTPVWHTPLACLYGLIPQRKQLMHALLPMPDTFLHTILSQPMPPERQIKTLRTLLAPASLRQQLHILRSLHLLRPYLTSALARHFLKLHTQQNGAQPEIPPLEQLHRLAAHPRQTKTYLTAALQATRLRQAALNAQLARTAGWLGETQTSLHAWEQACALAPEDPDFRAGLLLSLLKDGQIEQVRNHFPAKPAQHTGLHLAAAWLALNDQDPSRAAVQAQQALKALVTAPSAPQNANYAALLTPILLELALPEEAKLAAEIALRSAPNDPALFSALSQAQLASGETEEAAQTAYLAHMLAPKNRAIHQRLAKTLETAGQWDAALKEWTTLVNEHPGKDPRAQAEDRRALANCALQTGQLKLASEVCQNAIHANPDDGLAHAQFGKALLALGNPATAQRHFQKATRLTPDEAAPWLELAQTYQQTGQLEKGIETLQAAAQVVTAAPSILLALGKMHLTQDAPTQAAAVLRQAHAFPPHDAADAQTREIVQCLGQALSRLGHFAEASNILAEAYTAHPTDHALAAQYAHALIQAGEAETALTPLGTIVQANPQDPAPYLQYARALLQAGRKPEEAAPHLKKALAYAPPTSITHAQAQALLAEVVEAGGDLPAALQAYQKALDTPLVEDMQWYARLSFGLGRVALALDDYETALAALQEAGRAAPNDAHVLRLLSEAYIAADLPQNALEAAQTAIRLAPNDLAILTWLAEQVFDKKLHTTDVTGAATTVEQDVVRALERAAEIDPENAALLIHLGQARLQTGSRTAAWHTFSQALTLCRRMPPTPETAKCLCEAALGFLSLDDAPSAVVCLEQAHNIAPPNDEALRKQILTELAEARQKSGDLPAALETTEEAIRLAPNQAALYLQKIDLLTALNRPQAALACIEHVQNLGLDTPAFHLRAARILRTMGDLAGALAHAERAAQEESPAQFTALALAADLARGTLQMERAQQVLSSYAQHQVQESDPPVLFAYVCMCAEVLLDAAQEFPAIDQRIALLRQYPLPRAGAIIARLIARQGDFAAACQAFDEVLAKAGISPEAAASPAVPDEAAAFDRLTLISLTMAALELGYWHLAVRLSALLTTQAKAQAAHEPYPYYLHMMALTLRAAFYRISQTLNVRQHNPGPEALSDTAAQAFEQSFRAAQQTLPRNNAAALLIRWQVRGRAVFRRGQKPTHSTPHLSATPEDVAAKMAALRNSRRPENALVHARHFPAHPLVRVQMALTLARFEPVKGLQMAQHIASTQRLVGTSGLTPPLLHALIAFLAFACHDLQTALRAIQEALAYWPEEGHWHAFAAEIYQLQENAHDAAPSANNIAAIMHLEQAVKMEPEHIPHHIALAQSYLEEDARDKALQTLQGATEVSPQHPAPWLYLAHAHFAWGDLKQAALCADRAIELKPEQTQPLLLRAEIALQADDPQSALNLAQKAARLQPKNTDVLLLLSRGLEALDCPEDALVMLERAIPHLENPLPLQLEHVRLLRQEKGAKAALAAFDRFAQDNQEDPAVLAPLAETQAAAGKHETAIHTAQRALLLGKGQLADGEQAHLHFLLGRLLRESGQLDQAVHHLTKATRHAPELLEAYLELGVAHRERRSHATALTAYERAIAISPNDPRPYYEAGLALRENKDYKYAEEMLRHAAELSPQDLKIHRQLGALVALNLVHNR